MKKTIGLLLVLSLIGMLVVGCNSKDGKETNEKKQNEVKKLELSDVSAINDELSKLDGAFSLGEVALDKESNGIGVSVTYTSEGLEKSDSKAYNEFWTNDAAKKIFLKNGIILYSKFDNLKDIKFVLVSENGMEVNITRSDVEGFCNGNLAKYKDNADLFDKEIINDKLASKEKIDKFYKDYLQK